MSEQTTPNFTGRQGPAHEQLLDMGRDYVVIEFFPTPNRLIDPSVDLSLARGIHVFGPGAHPVLEGGKLSGGFGGAWDALVTVRAHNAEDAYRNRGGAMAQERAWVDGVADHVSAPYADEDGEYACDEPDEAAVGGMTRPDVFDRPHAVVSEGLMAELGA